MSNFYHFLKYTIEWGLAFGQPQYYQNIPKYFFQVSHDCEKPICQLRLDLQDFELAPPTGGNCQHDQFIIRANEPLPILCGKHKLFLHLDTLSGPPYSHLQEKQVNKSFFTYWKKGHKRLFSKANKQRIEVDPLVSNIHCFLRCDPFQHIQVTRPQRVSLEIEFPKNKIV